ncbi:guanine nucleotide binding protein, alpha subunit [Globomyces pollinis-pini]|nr:guanine nucleotide binding protein, alpha subunit [Globomyces pollinis-pini]
MGLFCSKPINPVKPTAQKALKSALRSNERDQIEYDKRLEEERAKSKARALDEYLKQEKAKYDAQQQEPRILILGSSDSGKSTFLKQLKILHGNGFTNEELEKAKKTVIFSLFAICRKIVVESPPEKVQPYKNIENLTIENAKDAIPADFTEIMLNMWSDPIIKEIYPTFGDIFPQSSRYFFDKLKELLEHSYVFTQEDMLLMRTVTQNISDNVFEVEMRGSKTKLHFFDVSGLKYHRKRWLPYFENVQLIVFLVAVSSYDQVLLEDKDVNRMVDAIKLFEDIVNHPLLAKSDMVVFFNKKDLFDIKIRNISLKTYFPTYTGEDFSSSESMTFFRDTFKSKNRKPDKLITFHTTCCTDTKAMSKVIPSVLKSIVNEQITQMGI